MNLRKLTLATIALALSATLATAYAKPIPEPPQTYVLDEPEALSPETRYSLETLLSEHNRLTSEQVVFAIFSSLGEEDLVDWTVQVFSKWKIGKKGKDNGVLLALYWKEHKIRLEVGYGLEPVLTDIRSKKILSDFVIPELKQNNPDRALSLAAMQILKYIGSPLIQSGKAEEILREGGFRGGWTPGHAQIKSSGIWVWVIVGAILLVIVLNLLNSADAHFTKRGWYRPSPWRRRDHLGGFGGWGGGGWSSGGGSGGFSGGGGSSGGGGASGNW